MYELNYEEKADIIRVEFDPRSPKLRLSIFAYLIENGVIPSNVGATGDFLDVLDQVTNYVAEDAEKYAEHVESFQSEFDDDDLIILDKDGDDPYGTGGAGYS
jgi:hypothetical protein